MAKAAKHGKTSSAQHQDSAERHSSKFQNHLPRTGSLTSIYGPRNRETTRKTRTSLTSDSECHGTPPLKLELKDDRVIAPGDSWRSMLHAHKYRRYRLDGRSATMLLKPFLGLSVLCGTALGVRHCPTKPSPATLRHGHGAEPAAHVRNGTYAGVTSPKYKQDFFLGIPYAQQPVGDLRLASPKALNHSWTGVHGAKEYGDSCFAYGGSSNQTNSCRSHSSTSDLDTLLTAQHKASPNF
ncbi:hypothetical protein BJY04DRAFT_224783 [Aspergillus karnatakaensis]|uniref:uncharacterized protein n=1 Tax=Aspergillus karnatakaensis TaxID=1810916 RepID=UPI003CCD5596